MQSRLSVLLIGCLLPLQYLHQSRGDDETDFQLNNQSNASIPNNDVSKFETDLEALVSFTPPWRMCGDNDSHEHSRYHLASKQPVNI